MEHFEMSPNSVNNYSKLKQNTKNGIIAKKEAYRYQAWEQLGKKMSWTTIPLNLIVEWFFLANY